MESEIPTSTDLMAKAEGLLHKVFGFVQFRPGQQEILQAIFAGEDVLAIMPTGGGKSLCYQLPALLRPGLTIVVSPLIALMKDQVDNLQTMGYPATFINSSLSAEEIGERLSGLQQGRYKLAFVAPERFAGAYFMDHLRQCSIDLLAVDEAHCISQWGHDFRPAYTMLNRVRAKLGQVQTIALTATATDRVQNDIVHQLAMTKYSRFVAGFDRPNLQLRVDSFHDRMEGVLDYLKQTEGMGIVYAGTRKDVDQITEMLKVAKIPSTAYHAGLPDGVRKRAQEDFIQEKIRVMVATNAFGMGIDKPNVRFVLHYQMPGSLEAYYQEAGRAGRDGDPADCIVFYSPEDRFLHEYFIETNNPDIEIVESTYGVLAANRDKTNGLVAFEAPELVIKLGENLRVSVIESALRLLIQQGYLARLGGARSQIVLAQNPTSPAGLAPELAQKVQLLGDFLQPGVWWPTTFGELAVIWEISPTETAALIEKLRESSAVQIAGPFANQGYFVLKRLEARHLRRVLEERRDEARAKLNDMVRYCQTASCRRQFILRYFGEKIAHEKCSGCDNCEREYHTSAENTVLVQKILSCVVRMGERFGVTLVSEVLAGSRSEKALRFAELTTYGILEAMPTTEIKKAIRATLAAGYLSTSMGEYPVLQVTEAGWEVLHGQRQAALPKMEVAAAAVEQPQHFDPQLFELLRNLRTSLAKARGVPPYAIFHDKTLREMASYFPQSLDELDHLSGIGAVKKSQLGPKFVQVVRSYLKRHHTEATDPTRQRGPDIES